MRKLYKFSHSVSQGGFIYIHKLKTGNIINKPGLRNYLTAISKKFKLIDVTIKIYDSVFFFFYVMNPSVAPLSLINEMQKSLCSFGDWEEEYAISGIYDVQKEYIRKFLKQHGLDYNKG